MEKDKGDKKKDDIQRKYACYNFGDHKGGDHGRKNIVVSASSACSECEGKGTPFVVPQ